jgi:hypothetical protein
MKAFPNGMITDDKGMIVSSQPGMDLRDYFAAKAIQGLMSNYKYDSNWEAIQFFDIAYGMAEMAYVLADEMMKAREQ